MIIRWAAVLLLLLTAGCDNSPKEHKPADKAAFSNYRETGDVDDIAGHGYLRLLAPRFDSDKALPRDGVPMEEYHEQAEAFAHSLNLTPVWVYVDKFADLIPALNKGRGDLIVTNLTSTDSREQKVDFSVPLASINEVLVLPAKHAVVKAGHLKGLRIAAPKGTSYLETARRLAARPNGPAVQVLPGGESDEDLIDGVARGKYRAVIIDSNMANVLLRGRKDVRRGPVVTRGRNIGWAVRADNQGLLRRLNEYLISHRVRESRDDKQKRSWAQIRKAGVLRVITSNNPASYFLWRGELMGFDYDLMKHFADKHHLRMSILVRDTPDAMFKALKEGRGDVIAASLTVTPRRKREGLMFSRRYLEVTEQVIGRSDEKKMADLAALKGRTLAVNPQSSFYETLKSLQKKGAGFHIRKVPDATTEQLIVGVADGDYDLTVADSHMASLESTYRDDIKPLIDLGGKQDIAWVLRPGETRLKSELDRYIGKEYRSLFYNVTFNRYFRQPKNIRTHQKFRVVPGKNLSPYDNLVKKLSDGKNHDYDWRLLVSQMYQESHFNPQARSFAGARGLMQVLPRTAKQFGYDDLDKPANGIGAGVSYLDWLWDRFPDSLPLDVHIYFTLAAYNAGQGHVQDARRLARRIGKNPDLWFGNVEKAMLLLSHRKYARQARFGYVRGSEPVQYVRDIRDRYLQYLRVTGGASSP